MQIKRLRVDDWQRYRDLRLDGLADTPEAFGETLDHARSCTERDWRQRLARMQGERTMGIVAVADDGTWTATMRSEITDDDAWLYGVYVVPHCRGTDLAQTLLATMTGWATQHTTRMLLHVAITNARARRFYDRNGFVETGRCVANPAHPDLTEIEMVRHLRG